MFPPGEEYEVTVGSEPPGERNLYEVETVDECTLGVANVNPGEECRVRVAATLGWTRLYEDHHPYAGGYYAQP